MGDDSLHFEYYFCELNKPDLREFLDENTIRRIGRDIGT